MNPIVLMHTSHNLARQTNVAWIGILAMTAYFLTATNLHSESKASTSGNQVWVVVSSSPKELEGIQLKFTGAEAVDIPQSKRAILGPISVSKSATLQIISAKSDSPLLDVKMPPSSNKTLIIVEPKVTKEGDLTFATIVKDMGKFVEGSWLLVNQSNFEFRIHLGDETIELNKGEDKILKASSSPTPTNKSLSFDSRDNDGEEWTLMSSSSVSVLATRREILIFTDDPLSGNATYHGLTLSE